MVTMRKYLCETAHELAKRKGIVMEKGRLMEDHVHMCIGVPPKCAVSNVVGYLKGKSTSDSRRDFEAGKKEIQ